MKTRKKMSKINYYEENVLNLVEDLNSTYKHKDHSNMGKESIIKRKFIRCSTELSVYYPSGAFRTTRLR